MEAAQTYNAGIWKALSKTLNDSEDVDGGDLDKLKKVEITEIIAQ